ncbi:MAG: hypothetical protein J5684_04555 [Eubacterium sp.]|nr:hypothetical protein [Eubacterium sp.]
MNLDSLAQELDRLYQFEISEYIARCDELKKSGFKIYRNSDGLHKVVASGVAGRKEQEQYSYVNNEKSVKKKENIFIRAKNKIQKGVETVRAIVRFAKFLYQNSRNEDIR